MPDNKPEITATIKFRGVTIEGMSIQELKELRDVLNTIVGEPQRVVERHDHYHDHNPWRPWYGTVSPSWSVGSGTITGIAHDGATSNGITIELN